MGAMIAERFFQTTRGRIVAELHRRNSASAADLAEQFGVSPNAIRQQLVVLQRDGLLVEHSVRRGPTKPTTEFSLTAQADKLFPQQYDRLLSAVLEQVREHFGEVGIDAVFTGIARRAVINARQRVTAENPEERVAQLTEVLREKGVRAEYTLIEGGFAVQEHNCPYADVVAEHPQVCSLIHQVIDDSLGGTFVQTASLADGDRQCRFEVRSETAPTRVERIR